VYFISKPAPFVIGNAGHFMLQPTSLTHLLYKPATGDVSVSQGLHQHVVEPVQQHHDLQQDGHQGNPLKPHEGRRLSFLSSLRNKRAEQY